jgi:hypothetical protein
MATQKNKKGFGKKKALKRLFGEARAGTLPPEFTDWPLADKDGYTVAHFAAWSGTLPADIDRAIYKLADKNGTTVAHVAAWRGNLPVDIDRDVYKLANKFGTTVAHLVARYGHFPADIGRDIYKLTDKYGATVAHVAAQFGHLPPEFEQWGMVDGEGRTVAEVAAVVYPPDSVLAASARQWLEENRANTPENEESGPRP